MKSYLWDTLSDCVSVYLVLFNCLQVTVQCKTIMSNDLFGGIEGGATRTSLVIYNGLGEKVVEHEVAESSNHWNMGMTECIYLLNQIVKDALKKSGKYPADTKLKCLGLCLSGCEEEETNAVLKQGLIKSHPNLAEDYIVCSDTIAPIAVAHGKGGAVIISGTGSNALLVNPSGKQARCGGWGHILGDEGSAYWIAYRAVKTCLDCDDDFEPLPPGATINATWNLVKSHFNIGNRSVGLETPSDERGVHAPQDDDCNARRNEMFELLTPFYANFSKPKVAQLCQKLSVEARNGDVLCKHLFESAGVQLGKMVQSLYKNAEKPLLERPGGLPIVCSGSVWKSWDLVKPGFVKQLARTDRGVLVKEISLIKLKTGHATGAAYLAAKHINYPFPVKNNDTCYVFYNYTAASS
uniref:N-acetyl-D-glucosamine kinase n=1 Tax=Cacopsylla melanoneura TaxID=428564 RepID=A0A8D8LNI4_9HEMI